MLSDGSYGIIKSIKVEKLSEPETTYNFEVEDFHTYFVGTNEVLVHNACLKVNNEAKAFDDFVQFESQSKLENHFAKHGNEFGD